MQREVCAAPDYKAMYFELFRASEQAARILLEAQQKAEEQIMEDDQPPMRLSPSSPEPSPRTSRRSR